MKTEKFQETSKLKSFFSRDFMNLWTSFKNLEKKCTQGNKLQKFLIKSR